MNMHSHAARAQRIIRSSCTPRAPRSTFAIAFLSLFFFSVSCSEETLPESPHEPEIVGDVPPATHLRVHTLSIQNTAFNALRGTGYVNLYAGAAYGGQEATDNAEMIDFRHQYRGRDIGNQRSFENLITKTRWDRTGLFTEITPTESRIGKTKLNEGAFDLIENVDDLIGSFDFQPMLEAAAGRHRRAYLSNIDDEASATIFAFIDKNGRRGLFKVMKADRAPINTVSEGILTIEVKIEDREGQAVQNPVNGDH
jgi:hypothetical protein